MLQDKEAKRSDAETRILSVLLQQVVKETSDDRSTSTHIDDCACVARAMCTHWLRLNNGGRIKLARRSQRSGAVSLFCAVRVMLSLNSSAAVFWWVKDISFRKTTQLKYILASMSKTADPVSSTDIRINSLTGPLYSAGRSSGQY